MTIGNRNFEQIIIVSVEGNRVLAVIADDRIVEKGGVGVILQESANGCVHPYGDGSGKPYSRSVASIPCPY